MSLDDTNIWIEELTPELPLKSANHQTFIAWIEQLESENECEYERISFNATGELVYVDIQETYATDEDLLPLKQMRHLEHLNICANEVTDVGLAHLSELSKLKYLDAGFNPITDAGLKHLHKMNDLETLVINGTEDIGSITDQGILHLATLDNLTGLHLNSAQITDDSVRLLEQFQKLRILDIGGTLISDSGIGKIRQSLPNCRIDTQPIA